MMRGLRPDLARLIEPPPAELEVFEEEAKSIITENDSPDVGFRFGVNPYRGCFHSCSYCSLGETPILMADGRTRPLEDVRVGDEIYGTVHFWRYRRPWPRSSSVAATTMPHGMRHRPSRIVRMPIRT